MEDFEYSVEISDRDWECFFAACEDCNLLPPSLAGVDDSGMSDIDDPASILAKRVQKVDLTAGFSEADCHIDGPPDSEGSPVEHYLSKHGIGGIESILSGSEDDIDLQSVNIFFERLKNVTEAKRLTEPSHVGSGINRRAVEEEKRCSDGQQASSQTFPKNTPRLNMPARGETAVGKETMEPVDISNVNTMKKDKPGSNISSEPAASNLVLKTHKSAHPESKLFIREEACTETRVNEATQRNQSHDSPDGVVCSEDLLTSQLPLNKRCSTDSWGNLEMDVKCREDQNPNFLQSDATSTNKTASQESSPSASIRRKRRKKRRLSVEPAESVHGYERQVSVKQSDSEEEQCAWRGGTGLCASEDVPLCYLNEPQKNVTSSLTTYSAISQLPVNISANEINDLSHYSCPCDRQNQYLPKTGVTQGRCEATHSAEHNSPNDKSAAPLGQTHHAGVMSGPNNSGNVATHLQPCSKLHGGESTGLNKYPGLPVPVTVGVTGKSNPATETANCARKDTHAGSLQQSDKLNHSNVSFKKEQNPESFTAEVKSITHGILPSAESYDHAVKVSQNDKLSAAKSVLAMGAGNSGRDNHTLCQREAERQQQLEIGCHYTDQYSSTLEKAHFHLSATGMRSCDAYNSKPKQFNTRACPFLEESSRQVDCAKLALDTSNSFPDKRCASDVTSVSSCCTLDTGSVTSLSNEKITDMSGSSCPYVSQNDSGGHREKTSLILAEHEEGVDTSGPKSQSVSSDLTDSKCYSVVEAEDAVAASKAECEPEKAPDSKYSVFAMSSFWSEMEKLTINDILRLRMLNKAASPSSLPPVQESEEIDMFAVADSGFFTELEEPKPEQTSSNPNSGCVNAVDSSSASGVMWEREPVPVSVAADSYPENVMSTSVSDIYQPVLPGSAQTYLRKISKNVSVHNLHALASESLSDIWKDQTLQTLDEGELEKVESCTDGHTPKNDKDVECFASSSTDSYMISLRDVFQYFFGGKQSVPSQSAADDITSCYTEGNSVPETYDHFFSEFDTESFFYPLITTADQAKDELVPIFSCSHSVNRNLQFPEAYDHFFASSSSDDSSDEEDNCGPVRVVSRFSRTSSATQIFTDIYDSFFTDSDLKQNLFRKNTLSFRNMRFTVQKRPSSPLSLAPVTQNGRSFRRTVHPMNVLGNQDVMTPDPLLHHLDDRISRQLAQQPIRYEDYRLQMAVSNPRLDASFLPLRQSDMCLVCIAFASWVLKTANPQVGDAWKAVLLANVSALSAIRYLRKYVKIEATASEKNVLYSAPSDS